MVCGKCEKKLGRLITPEVWQDRPSGSNKAKKTSSSTTKTSSGRQVNVNMLLIKKSTTKASSSQPYGRKCRICKTSIEGRHHFCQSCAYTKGICSMCGKKVLDTSMYKQSHA
mmetsp:Transcript_2316/g.2410  ORF Transcript_2316/g.2410 Transcript_2316/m.2410 type:complete len:112 (-) Transcript_2316:135-470(-)